MISMGRKGRHIAGLLHELSDEELLRLHREEKESEALSALFHRYSHKVLGLCISYLKNLQDAEDAAMEIFEMICLNLASYRIQRFDAWLYSVARNHCLKRLQRRLREFSEDIGEINPDLFVENEDLADHYSEDQLEKLSDAIDQLKEDQRRCVIMFFLEQRSYKEIADKTQYSLLQVKSHIQNGKRNLRNTFLIPE